MFRGGLRFAVSERDLCATIFRVPCLGGIQETHSCGLGAGLSAQGVELWGGPTGTSSRLWISLIRRLRGGAKMGYV
jgi:hypothetical protein